MWGYLLAEDSNDDEDDCGDQVRWVSCGPKWGELRIDFGMWATTEEDAMHLAIHMLTKRLEWLKRKSA